jgi:hypothetical protein
MNKLKPIVVPFGLIEDALDIIEELYAELDGCVETFEEYTPSGKLMDDAENIMDRLRGVVEK